MSDANSVGRLLEPDQVRQAQTVGALIRAGMVAPLIGAGLSFDAGLPTWDMLGERLIRSWQDADRDTQRKRLAPEDYLSLIRHLFGVDDLAFTSYLRHRLAEEPTTASKNFSALIYRALYLETGGDTIPNHPRPNDIHRHLVALFDDHVHQMWTTNYDNLLEQAALDLGKVPKSLHIADHQASRGLLIHHLHGYLPPAPPGQSPELYPVVLAEDDYHAVAANLVDAAWIDHSFYQLFETWHVLLLGMSLTDRNVRRVIATIPIDRVGTAASPCHFALMKQVTPDELGLAPTTQAHRSRLAASATALRAQHWADYGIKVIGLGDHHLLLPFLLRLRYESHGKRPGDLWLDGAAHVANDLRPWDSNQQHTGLVTLSLIKQALQQDFSLPSDEIADVGFFLLAEAPLELELVMRVGMSAPALPRRRTFSVDPDSPTGAAGCAFVAGSGMVVSREDAYHDYGAVPAAGKDPVAYAAVIQVPVVDWAAGGLPVGLIYVTVHSSEAQLLQRPANVVLDWLAQAGQRLLGGLLRRTSA